MSGARNIPALNGSENDRKAKSAYLSFNLPSLPALPEANAENLKKYGLFAAAGVTLAVASYAAYRRFTR